MSAGAWSARRRLAVVGAWLLVLLAGVLVIVRTTFVADMSAFLPAAPDAGQRVLVEQVQHGIASRMLLLGIEGGDARTRAEASRQFAAALRADAAYTQVTGNAAEWLMKLVPREPRLAAQVLRMRIAGQRAALTRIEIDLAGGDYSVMKLEPVASAAR